MAGPQHIIVDEIRGGVLGGGGPLNILGTVATASALPAAGGAGLRANDAYFLTDSGKAAVYNGTAWVQIDYRGPKGDPGDPGPPGGSSGDSNQSMDVYAPVVGLISTNPGGLDFKAPIKVEEPVPDLIRISVETVTTTASGVMSAADKVKLDGLSSGGSATENADLGYQTPLKTQEVLIVVPVTVKYQGVTTTMSARQQAYCRHAIETFPGSVGMVSTGKLRARARYVWRTEVVDIDAWSADPTNYYNGQPDGPSNGPFGGKFVHSGIVGRLLTDQYGGNDYDQLIAFWSTSAMNAFVYGLTLEQYSFINISDGTGGSLESDWEEGLVHEWGHSLEAKTDAAGHPLAYGPDSAGGEQLNGTSKYTNDPQAGYLEFFRDMYTNKLWYPGFATKGPIVNPDPRAIPVPRRPADLRSYAPVNQRRITFQNAGGGTVKAWPDHVKEGSGVTFATDAEGLTISASGDFNQSLEINAPVVGLISTNPNGFDFKPPMKIEEPAPDLIRIGVDVGTGADQVAAGNDARFTDARTPTAHVHSGGDITSGTVAPARLGSGTPSGSNFLRGDGTWAATGGGGSGAVATVSDTTSIDMTLTGTDLSAAVLFAADGTATTGKAVVATDSRLSNARTPSAHTHNASDVNAGTLATARIPDLSATYSPVAHTHTQAQSHNSPDTDVATTSLHHTLGTGANQAAAGNDTRLSDARTPTAHTHAAADVASGTLAIARIPTGTTATTVPLGNDARFSDARTPTAHTHPQSDVTSLTSDLALKAPLASPAFTGTPTGITKTHVGLANVDNTSDANKPVSTAQAAADALKANIASPTFTGTVGGISKSMVGLGNVDNTADTAKPVSTAQQTALDAKAPLASPAFTGTPTGINKSHVGLGNVDNTADSAKSIAGTQLTGQVPIARLATGTPDGTKFVRDDGTLAVPPGTGGGGGGASLSTANTWTAKQTFQAGDQPAIKASHLEVYPRAAGGSASLYLDNDNGQRTEFFVNNSGGFGMYNVTAGNAPMEIYQNAPAYSIRATGANVQIKNIDATSGRIINVATPTGTNDAANKTYVDTALDAKMDKVWSVAARTTADQALTSATLTNVTSMGFAIGANEVWGFEFFLQNGCGGAGGIRWAITVPSGATFRGVAVGMAAAITAVTSAILTASGTQSSVAFNAVALATGWTHITGSVANGSTAGALNLQFASNNAAQTSTVYANSLMTAQRIV